MTLQKLVDAIQSVCDIHHPDFALSSHGTYRWPATWSDEQRAAAAAIAADWDFAAGTWWHDTPRAIAAARESAISAIDARSAALIAAGLQVDNAAPVSLSLAAQTNLLNVAVAMQMGALTLPQDISRLDGRAYTITDAADAARIARLAGSRIKAVLDAGRELRARVLAATTQDQIEAVTDERT
jgi:hypothetical protein